MGAHALGGAKTENSGYKGEWTPPNQLGSNPNTFDTEYYTRLHIPTWTFETQVRFQKVI